MPTLPPLPPSAFAGIVLVAEAQAPPPAQNPLLTTLPIVLIVVAAYLLLFRPEREKQRRHQATLAGLKKNDRVLTGAGIYGTVMNVDRDADRVTLRVDDTARITVTLASIASVLGDKPDTAAARD